MKTSRKRSSLRGTHTSGPWMALSKTLARRLFANREVAALLLVGIEEAAAPGELATSLTLLLQIVENAPFETTPEVDHAIELAKSALAKAGGRE